MSDEVPLRLLPLPLTDLVSSVQGLDVGQPGDQLLPLLHLLQVPVEGAVHHPEVGDAGEGPDPLHLLPGRHGRVGEVQFPQGDGLGGAGAEMTDGTLGQGDDLQPGAVEEDGAQDGGEVRDVVEGEEQLLQPGVADLPLGVLQAGVAQPQLLQAGKCSQQAGDCRPAQTVPVQDQLREIYIRERTNCRLAFK